MAARHRPRPTGSAAGTALAVVVLLLTAAPAAALDPGGQVRDGTVFGLEAGAGWTRVKFVSDGEEDRLDPERAFAGGLSVGWARSDELVAGIGIYGWRKGFSQDIAPISLTALDFLAEVTWFPGGEGFWLKGGAGAGSLDLTAMFPQHQVSYTKGGFAWSVGAGWERRVTDQTAVGLAYDFRWVRVGNVDVLDRTTAATHAVSISLRYYP